MHEMTEQTIRLEVTQALRKQSSSPGRNTEVGCVKPQCSQVLHKYCIMLANVEEKIVTISNTCDLKSTI